MHKKVTPSRQTESFDSTHFKYFLVMTKIGVGDYGQGIIKDIHFRLTFEPVRKTDSPIEIIKVLPTDKSRRIGKISEKRIFSSQKEGEVGAGIKAGTEINPVIDFSLLKAHLGIGGKISKKNESDILEESVYSKQIPIVTSMGVGSDAIWEFKQGEAIAKKGQYDLNIYFKIRSVADVSEGYQVLPHIIINRKK